MVPSKFIRIDSILIDLSLAEPLYLLRLLTFSFYNTNLIINFKTFQLLKQKDKC